jgi:hypothetical protein
VLWWSQEGTNLLRPDAFTFSLVGPNGFELFRSENPNVYVRSNFLLHTDSIFYPVQQKELRVRVYNNLFSKPPLLGEFTIENPAYGLAKFWPRELSSAMQREDDFEATLTSVETGLPVRDHTGEAVKPGTAFHFQTRYRGALNHEWRIWSLSLTNFAGAEVPAYGTGQLHSDPDVWFTRAPMLWPTEPYLITAKFTQDYNSTFPEEDLWTVTNIVVPPPGQFTKSDATITRHGLKVRVLGIRRDGSSPPWPPPLHFDPFSRETADTLDMECGPFDGANITVVSITDNSGADLKTKMTSGPRNFSVRLDLKSAPKTLTVVFAIHRTHTLQWLAQPKLAPTNGANFPR